MEKYCYRAKVNCFIVLWQKERKRVLLLRLKYTLPLIWAYVSLKKSRIIQTAVTSFQWKSNLTVKANLITFMSWLCLSSAPSSLNVSRYYVISVIFISFYKTDSEIFKEFQLTISIFSELFANYIYTVCIIRKFYESSYESIINY